MAELTKVCSKCKAELPVNMFGKNRTTADGLQAYCSPCRKAYANYQYAIEHNITGEINCLSCGKPLPKKKKYCSVKCQQTAYRKAFPEKSWSLKYTQETREKILQRQRDARAKLSKEERREIYRKNYLSRIARTAGEQRPSGVVLCYCGRPVKYWLNGKPQKTCGMLSHSQAHRDAVKRYAKSVKEKNPQFDAIRSRQFRLRHSERLHEQRVLESAIVHDRYVKRMVRKSGEHIHAVPPELIEVKREQLKMYRATKQLISTLKEVANHGTK